MKIKPPLPPSWLKVDQLVQVTSDDIAVLARIESFTATPSQITVYLKAPGRYFPNPFDLNIDGVLVERVGRAATAKPA